jgi:sugar phosphate isomerase/epimerase
MSEGANHSPGSPGRFPSGFESMNASLRALESVVPATVHIRSLVSEDHPSAQLLGAEFIVSGKGPDDFRSVDEIKKVGELFAEAAANASEHGVKIAYHNHAWEMNIVDGEPGYRIFLESTSDEVLLEIDTYWVKVGGLEPAEVIEEAGERAPLIHMKDGAIDPPSPMMAVGSGKMDFPPIVEAAKFAELLVVELDECATDMLEAVEKLVNGSDPGQKPVARNR